MAFEYEDDVKKDRIIRECLSAEYDEYVAIAKGKYYYERVDDNPDAIELYGQINTMTHRDIQANINTIESRLIFFPHEALYRDDDGAFSVSMLFMFCVRCEILTYLKRLLPPHLKRKMKSIGSFIRDRQPLDDKFIEAIRKLINAEDVGLIHIKHLNKVYDFTAGGKRVRITRVMSGQIQCKEVEEDYAVIS